MNHNLPNKDIQAFAGLKLQRAIRQASMKLAATTLVVASAGVMAADVKDTENKEEVQKEVEELVVTGSRVARNPAEMAGQVLVYDEAYIEASGETTLERFLRRLPQNVNGTSDFSGSELNGGRNLTGASTANLRGLGSNATLILVDGRRIGNDGFLGGVTDISGIPMSRVERIEVVLDGASAVYGSDAVGGVINIITKKDYQGVTVALDYTVPSAGAFDEYKFSVNGGLSWESGNFQGNYQYYKHSGLEATDSRLTLTDQPGTINTANPPRPGFIGMGIANGPMFYTANGNNISVAEWNALDPADQAMYTGVTEASFPEGFNNTSDINDIINHGIIDNTSTGNGSADAGRLMLPKRESHTFGFSLTQDLTDTITLTSGVSYEQRDSVSGGGVPSVSYRVDDGNPFNPFGADFTYMVLLPDVPISYSTAESDRWNFNLGLNGNIGENWTWDVDTTYNKSKSDASIAPRLDTGAVSNGFASDGVTPRSLNVPAGSAPPGDDCTLTSANVWGRDYYSCAPADPINPFGNLSGYMLPPEFASNTNEQSIVTGNLRGSLFDLPAGPLTVAAGFEWQRKELTSSSEFQIDISGPVGRDPYSAEVGRDVRSAFVEGLVPLIGDDMEIPAVQSLDLSLSGRYDEYYNTKADRDYSISGESVDLANDPFNELKDPGGDSTWGAGLIWTLNDQVRVKVNTQQAFVAPQLNQLIRLTNPDADIGFAFVFIENPDGSLSFQSVDAIAGGNPSLENQTSDSRSIGLELTPDFLPGLTLTATHHQTDYVNMITVLNSNGAIVDLDNLPSDIVQQPDGTYLMDTRYINAASVEHEGIDYKMRYNWSNSMGDFYLDAGLSHVTRHEMKRDVGDQAMDVVGASTEPTFRVVPKYKSNIQFTWSYDGFNTSLDLSRTSDTKEISMIGDDPNFVTTTKSPQLLNMTVGYDFDQGDMFNAPEWMSGVKMVLGIQNLTNQFSETEVYDVDTGATEVRRANAQTAIGRGRVYNLTLKKEF